MSGGEVGFLPQRKRPTFLGGLALIDNVVSDKKFPTQ